MAGFSVSSQRLWPRNCPPQAKAFLGSARILFENVKHWYKNISNNTVFFCFCAFCVFYLSENGFGRKN